MTWFLCPCADKKLVVAIEGSVEEAKALYKPPEDSQGERLCPAPSRELLVLPPLAVHPFGLRGGDDDIWGQQRCQMEELGVGKAPRHRVHPLLLSLGR